MFTRETFYFFVMAFNLRIYKYSGRPNVIQKSFSSVGAFTLSGTLKDPYNIYNPTIVVRIPHDLVSPDSVNTFIRDWNYLQMSVDANIRYYFIVEKTILSEDKVLLTLKMDFLTTYANLIRNSYGTITESTNGNPYLSTYEKIFDTRKNINKLEFSNAFNTDENIIMITTKGQI